MNNKGHFVVHEWMASELGLKGTELMVYAIVYGFTQIDEQRFFGTRRYLSTMTGSSISAVQDALNSLVYRELLIKEVSYLPHGGVQVVSYRAKIHPQCKNCSSSETAHNDNKHISISNTDSNSSNTKRFTKPTIEELSKYIKESGYNVNPVQFYDFYESKGWKVGRTPMKDWKAAVRTWARNDKLRNGVPAKKTQKVDWGDDD